MLELIFDCETGGLDATKHPLLTLAGIIVRDGIIVECFDYKIKPFDGQELTDEALDINGITREQIKGFEEPKVVYEKLTKLLNKYKFKWDKDNEAKFVPVGYNVGFDIEFLRVFFENNGDKYLFSFINVRKVIDIYKGALFMHYCGLLPSLPNWKLGTLCEHFSIPLSAHDAVEDIRATYILGLKLKQVLSNVGGL